MNLGEKVAVVNGVLLGISEMLPLISRDVTKANSLVQLITSIFTKRKHHEHKRRPKTH